MSTASSRSADKVVDVNRIETGFRKAEFKGGAGTGGLYINEKFVYLKGFSQRSADEWAAVGAGYPVWMHDYTAKLIRDCHGNYMRWMHVAPQKVDADSYTRYGIVQVCPAGDKERDVTGRQWDQRVEVMRDTIIYFRNNPGIFFWEAGNTVVTPEQMQQMVDLRKQYDPDGGRVMGSRGDSNNAANTANTPIAEYYGVMMAQDTGVENLPSPTAMFRAYSAERRDRAPIIETEDFRNEGSRRMWDAFSPPFYKAKKGPNDTWKRDGFLYNSETSPSTASSSTRPTGSTASPTPTPPTPAGPPTAPSTSPTRTPTAARTPPKSAASAARWTPCACPRRSTSPTASSRTPSPTCTSSATGPTPPPSPTAPQPSRPSTSSPTPSRSSSSSTASPSASTPSPTTTGSSPSPPSPSPPAASRPSAGMATKSSPSRRSSPLAAPAALQLTPILGPQGPPGRRRRHRPHRLRGHRRQGRPLPHRLRARRLHLHRPRHLARRLQQRHPRIHQQPLPQHRVRHQPRRRPLHPHPRHRSRTRPHHRHRLPRRPQVRADRDHSHSRRPRQRHRRRHAPAPQGPRGRLTPPQRDSPTGPGPQAWAGAVYYL